MFKFYLFLSFIFTSLCYGECNYQLSICAIFQDEAPFLKEWIEFHRLVGVEHFYLYNHHSQDHYQSVLEPYLKSGIVELVNVDSTTKDLKSFNTLQCKCYNECLKKTKGISKWIAFLDIDEFLFPLKEDNLIEVLTPFEEFGGIAVNWRLFGPSHVWKISSSQLQIESLTLCSSQRFVGNRYVKSIVRPERTSHFRNPHQPEYREGFFSVNTDQLPFKGMWSPYIQTDTLRINHYWTRDGHYFYTKKLLRHKMWRGNPDSHSIEEFIQNLNAEKDTEIFRFLPRLKQVMENNTSNKF